jgi:hypothetical protein
LRDGSFLTNVISRLFLVVREEPGFQPGDDLRWDVKLGEDLAQQELQPSDEATEVVAGAGEDGSLPLRLRAIRLRTFMAVW